jgi:hypothetical protein
MYMNFTHQPGSLPNEELLPTQKIFVPFNEEPEELIRHAALIHNSVMMATSTEQ